MKFDAHFPRAFTEPLAQAQLKSTPQDFIVEETLAFPLSGQGEHLYLYLRKTNANTDWVCKQLARQLGVAPRDIGYAGLKDRHGFTSQWFSLPGKNMTAAKLEALQIDGVELCEAKAHERKLRKGAIKHNRFVITLRDVQLDPVELQERLCLIGQHGVPNYFDEQRFGHQRGNLLAAQQMFERRSRPSRFQRGLYLSSARSWLFNLILAQRILQNTWQIAMDGDVFWLQGTKRFFIPEPQDEELGWRLQQGDIHPTGALWGEGALQSRADVAELETTVAQAWPALAQGLEKAGLAQDRRPLRVIPQDLAHDHDSLHQTLKLSFTLPAGSYATAVVRELVTTQTANLNPIGM